MSDIAWQPTASISHLKQRQQFIASIRRFFEKKHYLEVDTPIMAQHGGTDVYLQNIHAQFQGRNYCLQTSPEYHMKRLLAAGSGPIFQIFKAFRDDEYGRWHNPEFSMLEWYVPSIDHHALMDECSELLCMLLDCEDMQRHSYQAIFQQYASLDPFRADQHDFMACMHAHGLDRVYTTVPESRDECLFLLLSHVIEPQLATVPVPVAIYDFPPSQAALARIVDGRAQRFEIYYRGVELANGFHELRCAQTQRARFEDDNRKRAEKNLAQVVIDPFLIAALEYGLPACSGVALGVDRVFALSANLPGIDEGLSFSIENA